MKNNNRYILYLLLLGSLLTAACRGAEPGDIYNCDGVKSVIVAVNANGNPSMVMSLDEAINIDADSALAWSLHVGDGWHLPSKAEMEIVRKNRSLINRGLELKKLSVVLRNNTYYWTSTPCSDSHVYACGPDGLKCYFRSNASHCYRARTVKVLEQQ